MTVLENLQMGATVSRCERIRLAISTGSFVLFPRLKQRIDQRGGTLSGGEQQMLAIARALDGRPRLLLLDEPSLGLAPLIVQQIFDAIKTLNTENGLTVFLVEQNAYHALKLAHRGYVMVNGLITLSGTRPRIAGTPEIKAAYLEGGRPLNEISTAFSIPEFLYEEHSFGVFLWSQSCWAAGRPWLAGRAIATTWRPRWQLPHMASFWPAAVRFIHFSSVRRDLSVASLLSGRLRASARVRAPRLSGPRARHQMVNAISWINESDGPLRWRRKLP